MHFITGKHMPRRTFLRGAGRHGGAAVPGRDGAGQAASARKAAARRPHAPRSASKRSTAWPAATTGARRKHLFAPADDRAATSRSCADNPLTSLEPYRDYLTIVSNTDVRMAEAFAAPEIGGDHFRSSAVFLTQSHPKQTQGSDIWAGTSLDQMYAQRFGQDTPLPSMQFCIENLDQAGGCTYNYSCAYTDSISWASPNEPLPMIRDPRVAFDMLFGAGGTAEDRAARRETRRSILDWIARRSRRRAQASSAPATARASIATSTTCARSSAASRRSKRTTRSGEARELPDAPAGVPDSFSEHMQLMFDLQVLALADRHDARHLVQDRPRRAEPRVPGERIEPAVPPGVAPRQPRGADPGVQQDLQVPRRPAAVLPRQAEEHDGRRQQPARQDADHLGLADGRPERPQPPPLPAGAARPRQRHAQGQPAPQGRRRHADGQRRC